MTTVAIKQKLIQKIKSTKNSSILQEVYRLLEIDKTDLDILKLSEKQKKKLLKAKEDVKRGRIISNQQANNEIDRWLKE